MNLPHHRKMNRYQRIDAQAESARQALKQQADDARNSISHLASYAIRSLAQSMRWHKFKQSQEIKK